MKSHSALAAAAADFLADAGLLAWHLPSAQRTSTLLRSFVAGQLDAEGLRAALGGPAQRRAGPVTKGSTAVLSLFGVLTPSESIFTMLGVGTSVRTFMQQLEAAGSDPKVSAIVVLVDSPGGSVLLITEAAQLMRTVRARKPVVAAVMGIVASAAYWVTSNATAIESTPSGLAGAIGVITTRVSITKQLADEGIDVAVIAAGRYKSEGHEAMPITAAERVAIQGLVDSTYADFCNDVAAGRQVGAAAVRSGFGEGRLVTAKDALKLRMIDRLALVEDTIVRAAAMPADRTAVMQGHRLAVARAALAPHRQRQARAEVATHRRALSAAARGSVTE